MSMLFFFILSMATLCTLNSFILSITLYPVVVLGFVRRGARVCTLLSMINTFQCILIHPLHPVPSVHILAARSLDVIHELPVGTVFADEKLLLILHTRLGFDVVFILIQKYHNV